MIMRWPYWTRGRLPPLPPSPPSGPPRGTNRSLRKLTHPRPPSPPLTQILTSSMNCMTPCERWDHIRYVNRGIYQRRVKLRGWSIERVNADPFLISSSGLKLHDTIDPGEDSVVAAEPHVFTGDDLCPPLSDQDTPCRDRLAFKPLDAQSPAGTIPPVS